MTQTYTPVRANPALPSAVTTAWEVQKTATTRAFSDPIVRQDLVVALIGGVLSAAALARAHSRLTSTEGKSDTSQMMKAAAIAVASGSVSILWKLYSAGKTSAA